MGETMTEQEYLQAIKDLDRVFDAPEGTPEYDEADRLIALIEEHEERHYQIRPPDDSDDGTWCYGYTLDGDPNDPDSLEYAVCEVYRLGGKCGHTGPISVYGETKQGLLMNLRRAIVDISRQKEEL